MAGLRIGVLGPGGVGGLLAATLARQGAEVTCLASEATASAIESRGITVKSQLFGDFNQPVHAAPLLDEPVEVLCVAVKETALIESLERVPLDTVQDAIVVPFLNGSEHIALLRERLGHARVVAATIRIESARLAPGEIEQKSPFAAIQLAPRPGEDRNVGAFAGMLRDAGFEVVIRDVEEEILWEKLSFLAPLALLTTAYGVSAGEIRTKHREELVEVITEAAAVARTVGVAIDPDRVLAQFDAIPETMGSSMQRDASAGQPIEIEAIGGSIVRAAERSSLEVPAIDRLVTELRAINERFE